MVIIVKLVLAALLPYFNQLPEEFQVAIAEYAIELVAVTQPNPPCSAVIAAIVAPGSPVKAELVNVVSQVWAVLHPVVPEPVPTP